MLRGVCRYFSSRPLFALLLAIDLIFVALHVWLWSHDQLPDRFNVEVDGSIPERFQYLKWVMCGAACGYALARSRQPLYLAWMALFVYFLIDDSQSIHELIGGQITAAFGFTAVFALRPVDFGELTVSLLAGILLLGAIALLYWRSPNEPARAFTRQLLPWLGLLIFFGIGVDMLHIQIMQLYPHPWAIMLAGVVEDSGEMISASGLTATLVGLVLPFTRRAPPAQPRRERASRTRESAKTRRP